MEIVKKSQIYGVIKLEARIDDKVVFLYESPESVRPEVFGGIKLYNQSVELDGAEVNFVAIVLMDDSKSSTYMLSLLIDIIDEKLMVIAKSRIAIDMAISDFRAFLQKRSSFNESQLKGLIGELIILDQLLERKKSVYGWVGAQGEPVDFVYEDMHFEIKSVENISKPISISSLEQLAHERINLVVNSLSACEKREADSINLVELGELILVKLESLDEKEYWYKQLNELGLIFNDLPRFVKDRYFKLNEQRIYSKTLDLPWVGRELNSLSDRIIDVKYSIDLNELSYKKSLNEVV